MDMATILVVLALLATIAALATGIIEMMRGSQFEQQSAQAMWARVAFQGIAVVLMLIALYFQSIA
jgi:uncharacterized membrane protein YozB (DUF420 family)